jgi:mannose-6-phosphate isomerase-like protein (cupin superfamily)
MSEEGCGGDPPCWAHLFEGDDAGGGVAPVVADLGSVDLAGRGGAVWNLPHTGDLDANLVHLNPREVIDEHVNREVDVLYVVQSGSAELVIDGAPHALQADVVALVPTGARRRLTAGPTGVTYLTVHRRRGPLTIAPT